MSLSAPRPLTCQSLCPPLQGAGDFLGSLCRPDAVSGEGDAQQASTDRLGSLPCTPRYRSDWALGWFWPGRKNEWPRWARELSRSGPGSVSPGGRPGGGAEGALPMQHRAHVCLPKVPPVPTQTWGTVSGQECRPWGREIQSQKATRSRGAHSELCGAPPLPHTRGPEPRPWRAERRGLPRAQPWAFCRRRGLSELHSKPRKQTLLTDAEVRSSLWMPFSNFRARGKTDPPWLTPGPGFEKSF